MIARATASKCVPSRRVSKRQGPTRVMTRARTGSVRLRCRTAARSMAAGERSAGGRWAIAGECRLRQPAATRRRPPPLVAAELGVVLLPARDLELVAVVAVALDVALQAVLL